MATISMIGLDLAKSVFQVHGVDASGAVVLRRQLRRGQVERFFAQLPPAVVGLEACGSAHHWGRVLSRHGHQVRLMPPGYVKPYVKRNKNDGRDAEAICEALSRPTMRFCAGQERGAAGGVGGSHDAFAAGASAHDAFERAAGNVERARDCGRAGGAGTS